MEDIHEYRPDMTLRVEGVAELAHAIKGLTAWAPPAYGASAGLIVGLLIGLLLRRR